MASIVGPSVFRSLAVARKDEFIPFPQSDSLVVELVTGAASFRINSPQSDSFDAAQGDRFLVRPNPSGNTEWFTGVYLSNAAQAGAVIKFRLGGDLGFDYVPNAQGTATLIGALPAGGNVIGKVQLASSIPAGGNAIGKVQLQLQGGADVDDNNPVPIMAPVVGLHANAWNAAAVLAGGVSASIDLTHTTGRLSAFGNADAATDLVIQYSQNAVDWYDSQHTQTLAAAGDFAIDAEVGAALVRLKSSAAATITATLAAH